MKTCSVPGCHKPIKNIRGYCGLHYQRWRRHGDPTAGRRLNGLGTKGPAGYIRRTVAYQQKPEHVIVAERALGKPLPPGVEVHHVDEDKANNRPDNLVICTRDYHRLIHTRMRALAACGHADWRKCWLCKNYGDPTTMKLDKPGSKHETYFHLACKRQYMRQYMAERQQRMADAARGSSC